MGGTLSRMEALALMCSFYCSLNRFRMENEIHNVKKLITEILSRSRIFL